MPVIGFVKLSNISNENSQIKCLPIGFDSNGTIVHDINEHKCIDIDIILFDDDKYSVYRIDGNQKIAILIQHKSNSENWTKQSQQLSEWGWRVSPIDQFSHVPRDPFWESICLLIDDKIQSKQNIIREIIARYSSINMISALDKWVAWKLLQQLTNNSASRTEAAKIWDTLMNDKIKTKLENLSFADMLSTAEKIAMDPIQWLKDNATA
ncbi:MAG: hypothetical protein C4575_14035 [Desulforudis sp.]|jgi:hypothetical protein|nr:MAG: hypothetical protein C4575_14035 [Desulforudis sp.]